VTGDDGIGRADVSRGTFRLADDEAEAGQGPGEPCPTDQRGAVVVITEQGRALIE
jgi:hypothetical protein